MDLSLQFKCRECAMFFREHHPTCPHCLAQGQSLPVPHRSRADIDSQPGVASARDIARMTWAEVKQYACPGLVLGVGALLHMEGGPGAGKSTLACRLADSVQGPAILVSAEEAIGPSLASRLKRCAIKKPEFTVVTKASVDIVVEIAKSVRAMVLVIDSIQEAVWRADDLRHVLEIVPSLALLIAVLQANKAGQPLGRNEFAHEADVRIHCEAMRWRLIKSRYQPISDVGGMVLPVRDETPRE